MGMCAGFFSRNCGKNWFGFSVSVLISIVSVALPTYVGGVRRTDDMESHIHFAQAFRSGIAANSIYPGWANDNLGFGSVGIRFYPPVSAYLTALFHAVTDDWYVAYEICLFGFMVLGCFGIYLFIRQWSTPIYGVFGAMLYAIAPYHVAEIYRFFLYAEFAALAILPFCLFYLARVCRHAKWSDVIPVAASCSLLALTHIPVTVMMVLILPVYLPIAIDWNKWKKIAAQLLTAAAIAGSAVAFFWIRVLLELPWVAHSDARYTVVGYERGPMLFPFRLFDPETPFPYLLHTDLLAIMTAGLLIPSIAVLFAFRRGSDGPDIRVIAATSFAGMFAMLLLTRPSEILWLNIELLQRLQFPFRLMAIVTVLAVASTALSFGWLVAAQRLSARRASLILIMLIVGLAAADIRQISRSGTRIGGAEFNALAERMQSERVAGHWWPAWAKSDAFENRGPVTASDRDVEILEWAAQERRFILADGAAGDVRVATFFYPYWHAAADGRDLEVRSDQTGAIILPVPEGRAEIDLRFEEPLHYTAAAYLSVITWLLMLGLAVGLFIRKSKPASVMNTKAGISLNATK